MYMQVSGDWVELMNLDQNNACHCSDLQRGDYSAAYGWYNFWIVMVFLPVLSVFGLCSNAVNMWIYSRTSLYSAPLNYYLCMLACSDFCVVLTGLFMFWTDSARSYFPILRQMPYTILIVLPVAHTVQTYSIYATVAAAIHCFFRSVLKNSAWSNRYCHLMTAKRIVSGIAIYAVLYNAPRVPQFNLRSCIPGDNEMESILEICPTSLFIQINKVYNVYMYMALMVVFPFFWLLLLNACIVFVEAKRARCRLKAKARGALLNSMISVSHCGKTASRHAIVRQCGSLTLRPPSQDDSLTMVMVVLLFLVCNSLALVVNVFETFLTPDPMLLNWLTDTSNVLVVFNSSVNFVIYYAFNAEFRERFIHLVEDTTPKPMYYEPKPGVLIKGDESDGDEYADDLLQLARIKLQCGRHGSMTSRTSDHLMVTVSIHGRATILRQHDV